MWPIIACILLIYLLYEKSEGFDKLTHREDLPFTQFVALMKYIEYYFFSIRYRDYYQDNNSSQILTNMLTTYRQRTFNWPGLVHPSEENKVAMYRIYAALIHLSSKRLGFWPKILTSDTHRQYIIASLSMFYPEYLDKESYFQLERLFGFMHKENTSKLWDAIKLFNFSDPDFRIFTKHVHFVRHVEQGAQQECYPQDRPVLPGPHPLVTVGQDPARHWVRRKLGLDSAVERTPV